MLNELNAKLKQLDMAMSKIIDNIRKVNEPSKKDLEILSSLYQMTLETYKNNYSINKLDILSYTDINEVHNILERYGYLEVKKTENKISLEPKTSQPTNTQRNVPDIVEPTAYQEDDDSEKKTDEDIEDIFIEQKNPFNSNGPVYAFANEALSQYMKNYDFNGKSVLASLGSGDFALNAYLMGASQVDTFDINQYTYYFYQLKKSLIMKYDFDSFCNFIKNPHQIFARFGDYKQFLDSESIAFFEKLVRIYDGNTTALLKKVFIDKVGEEKNQWNESNTFDSTEELFLIAQYKNPYLQSEQNYNQLKQQLMKKSNDEFYFEDLYQFTPEKKYDIVYLSNIGDYCKSEEEFKNFVMQLKERVLNENGIIIIVSITNHIMMDYDSCERTKMNWDEMEQFNKNNEGRAYLPICNLGVQNVYTTYPHQTKKHGL
ncbi:MAG: hypothetical protein IJO32_06570 [Bacilli bacterium]|nr:hypothetical protein [Bacilli bacterium]MBQ7141146.1 hypothetical protein [Bacilli bacterium]